MLAALQIGGEIKLPGAAFEPLNQTRQFNSAAHAAIV
jgi:hypothetical protein